MNLELVQEVLEEFPDKTCFLFSNTSYRRDGQSWFKLHVLTGDTKPGNRAWEEAPLADVVAQGELYLGVLTRALKPKSTGYNTIYRDTNNEDFDVYWTKL